MRDDGFQRKVFKEISGFRGDQLDAISHQYRVIDSENDQLAHGYDYSDEQVRMSTVHTRQDMVLLVSYLSAAAKRLKTIRWMVFVIMLCAVATTVKYLNT